MECSFPLSPSVRMCVTIPAKNEADYILPTLDALRRQIDDRGRPVDPGHYAVVVLANNCSDDTAGIARTYAAQHPTFQLHVVELTLPPDVACVGIARKLMMDAAARQLPASGIVAMTDADTLVDSRWVAATLRAFARGARAVGGRIVVPRGERRGYRRIHLQDVTYRSLQMLLESMIDPCPADPWPRHFQHYGPSLAVRADDYLACGGMPPVKCIEDAAFAWALERIDVQFVHDPAVRVATSDRRSDRVEGVAFSHALEEWTSMVAEARDPVVPGLGHCINQFKWKVALRRAFRERRISGLPALSSLAGFLGMPLDELQRRVVNAPTFGALYQEFRQMLERTHAYSDTPFPVAVRELRGFTRCARTSAKRPGGSVLPAVPAGGQSRAASH